jgi:hypothetical protein
MKQILKLSFVILLFSLQTANSQTPPPPFVGIHSLSFPSNPPVPTYSVGPARIYNNSTGNDPLAGALTVSAAFSNQVYGNQAGGLTGNNDRGMMFGVGSTNGNKIPTPIGVGVFLGNVGAPINSYFSPTIAQIGSGMTTVTSYAFSMYTSAEGLLGQPTNGRYEFGLVTFTFSRPVSNPVMHVTGLGGFLSVITPVLPASLPFVTDLELMDAGYTLTRLSGTSHFALNNKTIINTFTESEYIIGGNTPEGGDFAGTGSLVVNGVAITSVTFKVWLRGLSVGQVWSSAPGDPTQQVYNGDRYNISWTLPDLSQGTLPISGAQLKATLNNNDVNLTWSTKSESNAKEFEIERSSDGVNYRKIQTTAAAGNSATERNYSHIDPTMSSKIYFYRLKMVDLDGKYAYSNVAVVRKVNVKGIKTFPNPVTSQVNVEFNGSKGSYVISLINQAGQEMKSTRVIITNDVQYATIQRGTLAAGMYFIRVQNVNDASDNFVQKLVVQ